MAKSTSKLVISDGMKQLLLGHTQEDLPERIAARARLIFDTHLDSDFEAALAAVYLQGAADQEATRPKRQRKPKTMMPPSQEAAQ